LEHARGVQKKQKVMKVLLVGRKCDDAGLACVRSYGKRNFKIYCVNSSILAPTIHSKYVKKIVKIPGEASEETALNTILNVVKEEKFDLILPYSSDIIKIFYEIIKKDNTLHSLPFAIPPENSFYIALNKADTFRFCIQSDIQVPDTQVVEGVEKLLEVLTKCKLPLIVKRNRSYGAKGVILVKNKNTAKKQVLDMMLREKHNQDNVFLLQNIVEGEEFSVNALFDRGKPIAIAPYRKIQMLPNSGGTTSKGQSMENKDLERITEKALNKLNWHGFANIDFRKNTKDGTYKLIEINPRIGTSVEIACRSGVDLPYLYFMLVKRIGIPSINCLNNVILHWVYLELVNAISFVYCKTFVKDLLSNEIQSDFDIKDFNPLMFQLFNLVFDKFISCIRKMNISSQQVRVSENKL
jgi:predicted ATP-grasp superfamily ATP-dependent carboligase